MRVAGVWAGGSLPEESRVCVLILGAAGEHRAEALAETPGAATRVAAETQAFRAAFSVANRLVGLLSGPLRLDVDGVTVDLPAARSSGEAPVEHLKGTVVDGAVLVERRARRAELAEEAAERRAQEAERALATMETELARLELRFAGDEQERAALQLELDRRERELRASRQHAHAEQRLREDALAGADRRMAQAAHETAELREELTEIDRRAWDLEVELATARRRADEAQHRAETAIARAQRAATERERRGKQDLAVLRAEMALASAPPELAQAPRLVGAAPDHGAAILLEQERRAAEVVDDHVGMARLRRHAEAHAHRLAEAASAANEASAAAAEAQRLLGSERQKRARGEVELGERILALAREANSLRAQADAQQHARETAAAERQALTRSRSRSEIESQPATALAPATDSSPRAAESAPEPLPGPARPWLTIGLERLVSADATAAARLALELLPGQALSTRPVSYDLHVATLGWHEVTLSSGVGHVIGRDRPRDGGEAAFALGATPAALVRLVTDGGSRRLRRRGVRVSGTMRRGRALRSLTAVPLDTATLAATGILVDPLLLHRALALSIDPDWTRGHEFCLEHTVQERPGTRCFISVSDGEPVSVRHSPPAGAATTPVRTSHRAFQHALGVGPAAPLEGEGDIASLALLIGWARRGAPR